MLKSTNVPPSNRRISELVSWIEGNDKTINSSSTANLSKSSKKKTKKNKKPTVVASVSTIEESELIGNKENGETEPNRSKIVEVDNPQPMGILQKIRNSLGYSPKKRESTEEMAYEVENAVECVPAETTPPSSSHLLIDNQLQATEASKSATPQPLSANLIEPAILAKSLPVFVTTHGSTPSVAAMSSPERATVSYQFENVPLNNPDHVLGGSAPAVPMVSLSPLSMEPVINTSIDLAPEIILHAEVTSYQVMSCHAEYLCASSESTGEVIKVYHRYRDFVSLCRGLACCRIALIHILDEHIPASALAKHGLQMGEAGSFCSPTVSCGAASAEASLLNSVPELPATSWADFFRWNDTKFLESRRAGLNACLQTAVQLPAQWRSAVECLLWTEGLQLDESAQSEIAHATEAAQGIIACFLLLGRVGSNI